MICLHVEGRALWVRPEQVIAVGTSPEQRVPDPVATANAGGVPQETVVPEHVTVTIAFVGGVPVDETVDEVLDLIEI